MLLLKTQSGNNNVQQVSNGNEMTRNNNPVQVSELLVPETRFDPQTHTHHSLISSPKLTEARKSILG